MLAAKFDTTHFDYSSETNPEHLKRLNAAAAA
jgi:hypothetical protein